MADRHKPLAGQLSLTGDPPVMYCRLCGRMLCGVQSRDRGVGRTCFKKLLPPTPDAPGCLSLAATSTSPLRTEAVTHSQES